MATATQTVSLNVVIGESSMYPEKWTAEEFLRTAVATLGRVWIVEDKHIQWQGGNVWAIRVKVTAPVHELTEDAPIIAETVAAIRNRTRSVEII